MASHSNPRIFPIILFASVAFWVAGCAAALGPGYTIEKQEMRVHFVPAPEPHIIVEADYTLRNTGRQSISDLEVRLPGRRRFHFANAHVAWDTTALVFETSPGNERDELLTFPQPWGISSTHTLHMAVEFQSRQDDEPALGFSSDAFFLPAQGWSPELLPSRGVFATGGIAPKKWNLFVTVPAEFLVHASGKPPKKSNHGREFTFRYEQTVLDYYPFVIAGNYQSAQIGEGKEKVYLWTRTKLAPGSLHEASAAIVSSTKAYDEVFGNRIREERSFWIVECPIVAGCFTIRSSLSAQAPEPVESEPARAEMASLDTLMADLREGTQKFSAAAGPSLASGWLGYEKSPGFYNQDPPLSALPIFAAAIGRDASMGPEARTETIRNALRVIPKTSDINTKDDGTVLRAKSFLFFYALQDRYGAEVFRKATSHMFYARQGGGFDLDDLIAAFDQESHQNTAEFVRLWMKHPGVPKEFRGRYEPGSSTATQLSKEAAP